MRPKVYLLEAIRKLIIQKGINNINVQDILDEAHVSRATFYKYYRDKYDLANAYYSEYAAQNILPRYDGTNWRSLLIELMSFIRENRDYFRQLSSLEIHSFTEFLSEYGEKGYQRSFLINTGKTALTKEDQYRLAFYNAGCVRVVSLWIRSGCEETPEYIADLIISQLPEIYHKVDSAALTAVIDPYMVTPEGR